MRKAGGARSESIPKLGDFINDTYPLWFNTHHKAPKTKFPFNQFKHLFNKHLDKVTAWDIESWRSKRHKDGLNPPTSNRHIGNLKAIFDRAVEWEVIINKNPDLGNVASELIDVVLSTWMLELSYQQTGELRS